MTIEDIQKALLAIPRVGRAVEQKDSGRRSINSHMVVRLTRRYWRVNGNLMKLSEAIKAIL